MEATAVTATKYAKYTFRHGSARSEFWRVEHITHTGQNTPYEEIGATISVSFDPEYVFSNGEQAELVAVLRRLADRIEANEVK